MTSIAKPAPVNVSAAPINAPDQVGEYLEAWTLAPDEQSVRIVTVAFNPGEGLERFLVSLTTATAYKLVVVTADSSTKHDVVTAAVQRYGARVIGDGTNLGYGVGANLATAGLEEDWIMAANSDPVWKPGSPDVPIGAGLANLVAGCLGPLPLNPDDTIHPSGHTLPSLVKGAGHAVLDWMWLANPLSAVYHTADRDSSGGSRTMGWLSGACLLLPITAQRRLEDFDDGYFMFFEGVNPGEWVGRAGRFNMQVLNSVVVHEQGASWKAHPKKVARAHHTFAHHHLSGVYNAPWQAPIC